MSRFAVACALAALCLTYSSVATPILQGPVVNPANGHTYYLLDTDTWKSSEAQAVSMGGTLATIRSAAEDQFVYNTFSAGRELWIGLTDPTTGDGTGAQHAADFAWASGETAGYRNWSPSEPNNGPSYGGEYYTAIVGTSRTGLIAGDWNDENNNASAVIAYGVVEITPEPASVLLLGLWLLFSTRRARPR